MDGAVLVQAEDSRVDTQFMLDLADAHDWVLGVVGWVQLDSTDAARRDLDTWTRHPRFAGIRHLLNDDPRDGFLDLPEVRASLAEVARAGTGVRRARRLAAPPRPRPPGWLPTCPTSPWCSTTSRNRRAGSDDFARLARKHDRGSRRIRTPSASCRPCAGPEQPFTVDALREVFDLALALFGPEPPDVRRRLADDRSRPAATSRPGRS